MDEKRILLPRKIVIFNPFLNYYNRIVFTFVDTDKETQIKSIFIHGIDVFLNFFLSFLITLLKTTLVNYDYLSNFLIVSASSNHANLTNLMKKCFF